MALRLVYSTQLLAWTESELPPAVACPEGFILSVRDVSVTSEGGELINFYVAINDVATFIRGQFTIESVGQVFHWEGRVILTAGQVLTFESDGPTDGVISGYQLVVE
jgi:hypothetical protein